ncbi:MAG: hypothetical protein Q7S16_02635 [bacterium]|nr:hypothetical protein [bacterium]
MNKHLERLLIVGVILCAVLLGFYLGTRQQQPSKNDVKEDKIKVDVGNSESNVDVSEEKNVVQPKSVGDIIKKPEVKKESIPVLQPPALPE